MLCGTFRSHCCGMVKRCWHAANSIFHSICLQLRETAIVTNARANRLRCSGACVDVRNVYVPRRHKIPRNSGDLCEKSK